MNVPILIRNIQTHIELLDESAEKLAYSGGFRDALRWVLDCFEDCDDIPEEWLE